MTVTTKAPATPEPELTMKRIAQNAEARVQVLLDRARAGLAEAEKALAEAQSPVFGNGIAKGLQDSLQTVARTNEALQGLKVMISQHFYGSEPPMEG